MTIKAYRQAIGMSKHRDRRDWNSVYLEELSKETARSSKDWQNFDPKGNVYLIGNKSLGYYKIGLTRNYEAPDARFKTVQNNVPFDLDSLQYWFVSHARSFEKLLHFEFDERHIRGEWYQIDIADLPSVLDRIKELARQASLVALPINEINGLPTKCIQ